jgi:hypothetical protein
MNRRELITLLGGPLTLQHSPSTRTLSHGGLLPEAAVSNCSKMRLFRGCGCGLQPGKLSTSAARLSILFETRFAQSRIRRF